MLKLLRSDCGGNRDCPNVNRADDGSFVVVGYRTALYGMVRIPVSLVPEWDTPARRSGKDLLIRGSLVTDPATLAELDMASDEVALIVHPADVPELETATC